MALCHRLRFFLHRRHIWQRSRPLLADHPVDGRWKFTDPPIPSFLGAAVRSFAAPVQTEPKKPKADSSAQKGPRLNKAITAKLVRLVTAEGHDVVPIHMALDQAMKLKLDLVEVQGSVDPPVCKIMDFHKEKYVQEIKEKERAQNKTTLRTGDNKEVRFKAKTELKDLKIKADAVTRLMERGYRVKCTAMPVAGQGEENLGSQLSRLLALIEDVALVESGPHVSAAQAYVIVRHNKFATKKSGKKAIRSLAEGSKGVKIAVPKVTISSNPSDALSIQTEEELKPSDASSETECADPSEKDDHQVYNEPITSLKGEGDNRGMGPSGVKPTEDVDSRKLLHYKISSSKPALDVLKPKWDEIKEQTDVKYSTGFVPFPSEPAVAENNRYSKQDAKDRFHQLRPTGMMPQHAIRTGSERQSQFDPRQQQFDPASPSLRSPQFNRANPSSPSPSYGIRSSRNVPEHAIRNGSERQHQLDPRQKQFNPGSPSPQFNPASPSPPLPQFNRANPSFSSPQFNPASPSSPSPQFIRANPSSPSPSYGIRSTGNEPEHAIRNGSERQRQFDPRQKQFNPSNSSSPSPQFNPADPSSSSPSYGIFSGQERAGYRGSGTFTATKTAPTSNHNHSGDAGFSKSTSPGSSPSYGLFSTPKTVLSDEKEK